MVIDKRCSLLATLMFIAIYCVVATHTILLPLHNYQMSHSLTGLEQPSLVVISSLNDWLAVLMILIAGVTLWVCIMKLTQRRQ